VVELSAPRRDANAAGVEQLDGSFGQGRTAAKRQNVGKPAHGETPREGSLTASDPHSEATSGYVGGPPAIALQKSGGPEVPGPNPGAPTNESPLGRSFLFPARQRDWLGGDAVATDHRRSRSERASRGGGRGARERPGRGCRRRLNGSADAWIRPRRFAVRARKYDQVAVRITQPELAMARSARPAGGIAMRR
jgi:hypothetical protein